MQTTIAIETISQTLLELIDLLAPGDEVVLTRNNVPLARIHSALVPATLTKRPPPGLGKDMVAFIADDFDAPLDCMKEYME